MPARNALHAPSVALDANATTNSESTQTSVSPAPSPGQRCVLGEEIGHGGMGAVYRAIDTTFGREVAVKVLHERFAPDSGAARRFADEARITGQLQHPGIPPVHDLGTLPDGRPFLAMKLIRGSTLGEQLSARPELGSERGRFVAAFEQVCHALAYAHAHNVIHRDLKPANVMVGNFGEVQVMDWGLAKVLPVGGHASAESDPDATTGGTQIVSLRDSDGAFTQAGSVLGTPAFMPPEQALGAVGKVDARSDVFGLGAILAVILTGKPPFDGGSGETVRIQAAQGLLDDCFARLDGCAAEPELVALCKRCLSPKPADRPSDASEVAKAVAQLRAEADERARRADLERAEAEVRVLELRKRRRTQLTLGVVVLLALSVGGWIWQAQHRKRTTARSELSLALGQSQDLLAKGNPTAAIAAARKAEGLLGAAGNDPRLQEDIALRLREIEFVGLLDKIRAPANASDDRSHSRARADARYAAAFRALDIDLDALAPEEAVKRIEARPALKPYLIAALDDWVGPRRQARADPAAIRRLLQVSRLVDPDPWRDCFRDAVGNDDLAALLKLADEADAAKQTTSALLTLGGLLNERGHRSEAIALLRRAEWEHPDDFWLLCYQGAWNTFDVSPEALEEGVRCFSAAVALRPHFVEAWTGYSVLLGKQGKTDEALRASRRAVELAPNAFGGHLSLEKALAMKGKPAEADVSRRRCLELLREHLRNDPDDDEAWLTLGIVLEREGDLAGALEAAREAARIAQQNYWARHNLGTLLRQQGKPKEALVWLENAARLAPDSAHILISLSMVRTECGDREGAEKALRKAIEVQPHSLAAYGHLADLHRRRKDVAGSRATLELGVRRCSEVLQKYPRAYHAIWQLGMYRWKLGDTAEAVAHFRRAIALNPSGTDAYIVLSLALNEQRLLGEALAASREGVRLSPPSVVLFNNLAFDLLEKGESPDEAARVIAKALALNPASDVATLTKAEVLRAQGKFAESLAAYRRGHELHQQRGGGKWPTGHWVKEAERLVQRDGELSAVLKGERKLTSATEHREFGELCAYKGQHAAAARFYGLSLAEDAARSEVRTEAAKSAILAGLGLGLDAPSDEGDRAVWRKQASQWLRESLGEEQKRAIGTAGERLAVWHRLNYWRTHDALSGVRDTKALEALPEEERREWQKLWSEIADTLAKAASQKGKGR